MSHLEYVYTYKHATDVVFLTVESLFYQCLQNTVPAQVPV